MVSSRRRRGPLRNLQVDSTAARVRAVGVSSGDMTMTARSRSTTSTLRTALRAAAFTIALATPAWSQTFTTPRVTHEIDMSGPRFGLTVLGEGNVKTLEQHH